MASELDVLKKQYLKKEKTLQSLLKASKAVLQYSSFEESAREIFLQAKEISGATAGYVALLTSDGMENEVLFLDAGKLPCQVDPELPMPIRGLREEAYRTGKAVFDNDFKTNSWYEYLPAGHVPLKNVLFAPLNIDGKTVGLIGLANKPVDFTKHDALMTSAVAEFAAIALHNSRTLDTLRETVRDLEAALREVKTLRGIIPICAKCKKIRDDKGYWQQLEAYFQTHMDADFSHGLCPDCYTDFVENLDLEDD